LAWTLKSFLKYDPNDFDVLIVDDISDSGTTLSDIITNIDGKTPIVCIFKRETTELGPDLVFETIKDEYNIGENVKLD